MNWIWNEFGFCPPEARVIRETVFVQEQGFCDEFDEIDDRSWHVLLLHEGKAVGTARIFFEDCSSMHIGRVAVEKAIRKCGMGSALLRACCEKAAELGAEKVILGAQCHAVAFYEKNGFQPYGDRFDEQGCPHQMMEKNV